jgi:hypothetical protein
MSSYFLLSYKIPFEKFAEFYRGSPLSVGSSFAAFRIVSEFCHSDSNGIRDMVFLCVCVLWDS